MHMMTKKPVLSFLKQNRDLDRDRDIYPRNFPSQIPKLNQSKPKPRIFIYVV